MARKLYTKEEIMLCTYIAKFGRSAFDESSISRLQQRSIPSIKMKVQNIAAMLTEEGFKISQDVAKLFGKTTGKKGRRRNWDIVSNLVEIRRNELFGLCEIIIKE